MSKLSTLCYLLIVFAFSLPAADDDGPLATRTTHRPPETNGIRVNVDMALVPVSVMDYAGRSVTGLERENFRVYDGATRVPIVSFGRQDQPVAVGLVFDCSASMRDKFRTAHKAPAELFRQLNADDESFLVTVSNKAELKYPFTSNFTDLENALLFARPDGTTSLVDGVYLALQAIQKAHNPRRAVVIVSDGGENNSRYTRGSWKNWPSNPTRRSSPRTCTKTPKARRRKAGPNCSPASVDAPGGQTFWFRALTACSLP
jgi:hypothetical protein